MNLIDAWKKYTNGTVMENKDGVKVHIPLHDGEAMSFFMAWLTGAYNCSTSILDDTWEKKKEKKKMVITEMKNTYTVPPIPELAQMPEGVVVTVTYEWEE